MNAIKKFFGFSLGPIISAIIGFITVPLTTYYILPAEYGKSSLFQMIEMISLYVIYLGLDMAYIREYHEEDDKGKLFINSIFIPLVLCICLLAISPMYVTALSNYMFSEIQLIATYIMILSFPFSILTRFILLSLRMREKAFAYSINIIVPKILTLAITFACIFFFRRDYLAIVYSSLFGTILACVLLLVIYKDKISIPIKKLDFKYQNRLIKFGVPIGAGILLTYMLNSTDKIFIKEFCSYEELGYYSVALRIVSFVLIIQSAFSSYWTPVANRWRTEGRNEKNFSTVINVTCCVVSFIFIGIITFKDFIVFIVSKEYEQSIYILPLLLFYPIMSTISVTTEIGINFSRKTKYMMISSCIALCANIILNYLLVPRLAAKGAALTTCFSYVLFFYIKTYISRKLWYKFPVWKINLSIILLFLLSVYHSFYNNFFVGILLFVIMTIVFILIFKNDVKNIIIMLNLNRREEYVRK